MDCVRRITVAVAPLLPQTEPSPLCGRPRGGETVPLWRERGTEVDHQPDDFARREVLLHGFVGEFGELANEFLEDQAHLRVRDDIGMEIDVHELFRDPIEYSRFVQAFDLGMELEPLEDVADRGREALQITEEVFAGRVIMINYQISTCD